MANAKRIRLRSALRKYILARLVGKWHPDNRRTAFSLSYGQPEPSEMEAGYRFDYAVTIYRPAAVSIAVPIWMMK